MNVELVTLFGSPQEQCPEKINREKHAVDYEINLSWWERPPICGQDYGQCKSENIANNIKGCEIFEEQTTTTLKTRDGFPVKLWMRNAKYEPSPSQTKKNDN